MWFVFTIATTLIWGLGELFYKKGALESERYSHLKISICVGLVMGIHALYVLLFENISFSPVNLVKYLPVSLCYILSMTCSYFGIRFIEESIADPIENTSGAICALLCVVVLKESIDPVSVTAILVIATGVVGLGVLENKGSTDRKKVLGKKMAVIAFAMPFCYAVIDALGSFLDIYYLDMETSPLVNVTEDSIELVANTAYELTFALCALMLYIFIRLKGEKMNITKQKDKLLSAVCETAGQLTYVYAMSGNGAIAAPILSSVCVVSLLLSRIFLKEKLTAKQYLFIALVIAGILILAVIDGE